ncbi:putative RING finger protein [Rhizoctonia solani 123E]|uniref:Putative RING finger protein n=1 Tax=Rhizoctonia solani 123E TaxID=1423351 RepID=A0A074S8J8_9AGAM|nr:putative RING finger protein [Rhizoctonia solani 123E]
MDSSTHSLSFSITTPVDLLHSDMGSAISAVRNSRKRRADPHHDEAVGSANRNSKRMREEGPLSPGRTSEPPDSADTTLVNDTDDPHQDPKGKARDTCSSSILSLLPPPHTAPSDDRGGRLVNEIESELRCGCCTELAYNPVSLNPCHHFFCGSCMTLHLSHSRNAPNYTRATCPACRTALTSITPSRVVQSLVAALVRVYPERARTERERAQADEIYMAGREIPIPPPRASNPDVLLPQQQNSANDNLARPCPHCAPNNSFDWTCPRPIPNPDTDRANAWNVDNGPPPGHNYCGACDELYAIGAPTSSRCDMCTTGFCGISVPQVCRSHWLHQVRLMSDYNSLQGLIESDRIYDIFNNNSIEVEILFDYLREAEITPNMIYLDIIDHIQATPEGFESMIARDAFRGSHPVDMRVSDTQYMAARSREQLSSVIFTEFTDEEDSDDEREDERRRTGVSASGSDANRSLGRFANGSSSGLGHGSSSTLANGRPSGPTNGSEASPTTVLPRLADLMRSMRDTETPPSLTLPAVSRRAANGSMSSIPIPSTTSITTSPLASSIPAPTPPSRRRRICRECATEVFLSGLKDWWAREMRTPIGKERLPVWVVSRQVCGSGDACAEQMNNAHAKAFCHVTGPVGATSS